MRKIFATIFLGAVFPALAGAPPELMGEADPGVPDKLYDTAASLATLFRSPWRKSTSALMIVFSPAVPERSAELGRGSGKWVLMLNGSPGRWNSDFALRRKVFSALLLAASGARMIRGESRALPPWVVAAATRRLDAQKREERLLGGNFRSPVLRALLERGKLPAAAAVRAADPERFTPAMLAWTDELAAALFFAGGKKLASADYLRRCGENAAGGVPAGESDRFWMPDKPEELEARFSETARRMAWHELSPRPARRGLELLAALRKIRMPVLDDSGKPVPDKTIECDVLELAERLRGRPDAASLSGETRRRFFEFCFGDSRRVKAAGALFSDLIGQAHRPPLWYSSKLNRALDRLYAELRRREKLDAYMTDADFRHSPVRRHFRRRLESLDFLDRESSLLSGSRRAWFARSSGELSR